MRTTVDIEAHLLKRLRAEARRFGVSVRDLLQALLRRGLDERPSTSRSRYRCPSASLGRPHRPIRLDKTLALASSLEDDEIAHELSMRK